MHKITLLDVRHSAAEKLAKEKLRVEVPAEYNGDWFPAVMYVPAYPRQEDHSVDAYTFKCVSVNASLKRLRRLYTALGGRAMPPWSGILVDGVEVNGNVKDGE